jgi:hypothetical protein
VRQRPFVLEDLAEITAVDPAATRRAPNEMLGFVGGQVGEALPGVLAAEDGYHRSQSFSASRFTEYSSELVGYVIEGAQGNPVCAPGFLEVSVP